MSWLWGSATNPQYEELVEKACSPLNLPYPQSEDIAVNLEITDLIRSKAVQPKPAMQSLKRRIASRNGRIQMYAIGLVDTCIKNGGDHFLAEIASKEFVDEMAGLIRSPLTGAEVKQMALQYFQMWALAFESKRELSFLVDVYREMKSSGTSFPAPPSQTSSHLLTTTTAPTWVDSDVCMRCRSAFTFTNRKHHCRNCGLVYDQACSSHVMPLPKFGIAEPVRVCDTCYLKDGKVPAKPPVIPGRTPRSKADFDADLQRAIELSLADSRPSGSNFVGSEPPLARKGASAEDDDEELRLAIEASLREMERDRPTAPQDSVAEPEYRPLPTFDLSGRETETILTFSNTLDQMSAYGERDLRRFPHAHILAEQAWALSGKLQRNAEEKTTKQQMLHEMQDKLSQAVSLYGQILDGQQAFSAQQLQEQQARQYYAQQQAAQRAMSYTPQTNGYSHQYPVQPTYQPPQAAKAGPSLYPSMPNFAPQYNPPQPQSYGYHSPQPQPQPYLPQPSAPASSPVRELQQAPPWAQPQPQLQPQHTPQQVSNLPQPQAYHAAYSEQQAVQPAPYQHMNGSHSYEPAPQASSYDSSPSRLRVEVPPSQPATASPQAPPPVDMNSHPASSPTLSVHSALPPQPSVAAQTQVPQHYNQQYVPTAAPQSFSPQKQPVQPQTASYPFAQGNVYSSASFPEAPSAVFPDAPAAEPNGGLEHKEMEEALLIEL